VDNGEGTSVLRLHNGETFRLKIISEEEQARCKYVIRKVKGGSYVIAEEGFLRRECGDYPGRREGGRAIKRDVSS